MSNFFRDSSMGFKPRSNIFSKLRIKDTDAHIDDSLTEADSSFSEDLLMQSNPGGSDHMSTTVGCNSDNHAAPVKFQLSSSTPKATRKFRQGKSDTRDEFDLEITEVRDVLTKSQSNGKLNNDKNTDNSLRASGDNGQLVAIKAAETQCTDTSSNDVLLEAFDNTQKICSSLKHELQRQQTENAKLKSQIQDYHVDSEKMLARFADMKQLLTDLNDKSMALSTQKGLTDANLEEIKNDHDRLKRKVENYRSDIAELKITLTGLQALKSSTDTELSNRGKEIDYLKRELNDCSGQLSEEKLKNSSLIQEIGKTKDGLKDFFSHSIAEKQLELNNEIGKLETNVVSKVRQDLEALLNRTSEDSEASLLTAISKISMSLSSEIQQVACDNSTSLTVQIGKIQEHIAKDISTQLQAGHNDLLGHLSKKLTSQDVQWEENFDKIYKGLQQCLTGNNENLSAQLSELIKSFNDYKNRLNKCEDYESRLSELQSQISSLNLQKGQALTSLGVKEAQYEDLVKQMGLQSSEISTCKETKNKLRSKLDALAEELSAMKAGWSRLNEENITLKANSENKLIVQGELLKGLQSENESLKLRNQQLDEVRKQFETENSSHLDKAQRLNDHLQKLNVEMVQLKAHELELEEANRKMKTQLEQDKISYEEATDDFKRLRQKVIVLEGEKQDNVREKIDLQDKNDELRESIKTLKQTINKLQRAEAPAEKQEVPRTEQREEVQEEPASTSIEVGKKEAVKAEKAGNDNDEFDLSSSLNDDLELTNPSPIQVKPLKTKRNKSRSMKPPNGSRKKLLLLDEDESTQLKHRWKKRRA